MQETLYLHEYPFKKVMALSRKIVFFREIFKADPFQFEGMIENCKLIRVSPGEMIIEKGTVNYWIYFVLQGACWVYMEANHAVPVNRIGPGSMFGELSVILEEPRTAFVKAHPKQKTTLVGIDAAYFSSSNQNANISINVRILFFKGLRNVVYKKARQLEQQLLEYITGLDEKPVRQQYDGPKNQEEELVFYESECARLGHITTTFSKQLGDLMRLRSLQSKAVTLLSRKIRDTGKNEEESETAEEEEIQQEIYLSDLSVLIADKDDDYRSSMKDHLYSLGITSIKEVGDGTKAWRYISQHRDLDVVFCNFALPNMSGIDLLSKVLISSSEDTPLCIIVTEDDSEDYIRKAAEIGVHGYIYKQFFQKEVPDQLQQSFQLFKNILLKREKSEEEENTEEESTEEYSDELSLDIL